MGSSYAERAVTKNETQTGAPKGDAFLFFRNFFRHPRMLGSIIPSSRFLIKQLLQPIDWDKARVIVEYGPGVGGITAEILRRMRPDAKLVAIEMNGDFVSFLGRTLVDERFHVVQDRKRRSTSRYKITAPAGKTTAIRLLSRSPIPILAANV